VAETTRTRLAGWFRERSVRLTTLDPDAPLDDLEPLLDVVGDARVVALGEGCHFVREFTTARTRLIRFLAERCGFTVLAFEFGFAEAGPLDAWLRGAGADADLARLEGTTSSGVNSELVRWVRRHNRESGYPLRFIGLDTPVAGGTLRPNLEPVAEYLREVDPDAVPTAEAALAIADRFAGRSVAVAAPLWGRLDRADQDALTAALSRLLLRLRALEAHYVAHNDQQRYDLARHQLEGACHADYMVGTMREVLSGGGLPGDASVREAYMAASLRWHLDRLPRASRVVLAAHNNHIQKTPVVFDGQLAALPLGFYLERALGSAYRALAMTHTADEVPEMHPDESPEVGFAVVPTRLAAPSAGSVEAAVIDAGYGADVTLTDLRASPHAADGRVLLDRIRTQSAELPTPVPEAYDAVLCVPTATADVTTTFAG
jgi:erythromycin esterase